MYKVLRSFTIPNWRKMKFTIDSMKVWVNFVARLLINCWLMLLKISQMSQDVIVNKEVDSGWEGSFTFMFLVLGQVLSQEIMGTIQALWRKLSGHRRHTARTSIINIFAIAWILLNPCQKKKKKIVSYKRRQAIPIISLSWDIAFENVKFQSTFTEMSSKISEKTFLAFVERIDCSTTCAFERFTIFS